eukprot:13971292-Alexandrium_andersonii.AAC.1
MQDVHQLAPVGRQQMLPLARAGCHAERSAAARSVEARAFRCQAAGAQHARFEGALRSCILLFLEAVERGLALP